MTTERTTPKYPSQEKGEIKAGIQTQLDINEKVLFQLSELVSNLTKRLEGISLPENPCEPSCMKEIEVEDISPLRRDLHGLNLQTLRIIEQVESLINRLEI